MTTTTPSKPINGTNVLGRNFKALNDGKTLIINYGSSRSSKSFSIVQLFHVVAVRKPNQFLLLVGSAMPKVKKTLIRDFMEIADFDHSRFNRQDATYHYTNGSIIQFMSAENPINFIGLKTDLAFLDEVNTYRNGKQIFNQLEIRNEVAIFVAFNPTNKFWITDFWDLPTTEIIHSTFLDNLDNLPDKVIKGLLARRKTDPNFWKVYGLGEWGSLEGLIFKEGVNFTVGKLPEGVQPKWTKYAVDFGFSNDPCAVASISYWNGQLFIKELIYDTQLTNQDLANRFRELGVNGDIVADSAEPKSIEELWREGFNITPARKGPDSILFGLQLMKDFSLVLEGKNLIDEFRNYAWEIDKRTEQPTNKPQSGRDHLIDSVRYFIDYQFGGDMSLGGFEVV